MKEKYGFKEGDFPVCEYVAARTLALPFFGAMSAIQVEEVCLKLEEILESILVGRRRG
jgi:perosamine synthetase